MPPKYTMKKRGMQYIYFDNITTFHANFVIISFICTIVTLAYIAYRPNKEHKHRTIASILAFFLR